MSVVTRFAPSPTGYLHIGGARTALFNWLFARKHRGKFILRIEDTDRLRSSEESTRKILEDLKWLGLNWDEGPEVGGDNGPYFQSQRIDIYNEYLNRLLEEGRAYKCFETAEELAAARERAKQEGRGYKYDGAGKRLTKEQIAELETQGRPYVVRLAMPEEDIIVSDTILGDVRFPKDELEDFVIRKSDGFPTYHFAVVVDDYLMGVTHVIRGQEHLMNTPKHVALQMALGFASPIYAHVPLIFNMDGSKMSKRDKEKAIKKGLTPPEIDVYDFRKSGYIPEALLNFIVLLGWSPGGDKEFMTIDEMRELFSLERIGKTNAKFDRDKLLAFNSRYIQTLNEDRLKQLIREFLADTNYALKLAGDEELSKIIELYRPRAKTLKELAEMSEFFFAEEIRYDEKAVRKFLQKEHGRAILRDVETILTEIDDWDEKSIENGLARYCEEKGLKFGKVAQPVRVAVTGTTVSPPIFETLVLLGREKVLRRFAIARKLAEQGE